MRLQQYLKQLCRPKSQRAALRVTLYRDNSWATLNAVVAAVGHRSRNAAIGILDQASPDEVRWVMESAFYRQLRNTGENQ